MKKRIALMLAIIMTATMIAPVFAAVPTTSIYAVVKDDAVIIRTANFPSGPTFHVYMGYQHTQGKTPRNFVIDPTDAFLLVANQDSDTIVTFRIDQESGQLTLTGNVANVPTPVCLKFLQL